MRVSSAILFGFVAACTSRDGFFERDNPAGPGDALGRAGSDGAAAADTNSTAGDSRVGDASAGDGSTGDATPGDATTGDTRTDAPGDTRTPPDFAGPLCPLPVPSVTYVDRNAAGAGDGSEWCDAYPSLSVALAAVAPPAEIWVAQGTYTPGTARTDAFTLATDVFIYGGFTGTETARNQRALGNLTILDGDLNGDDVGTSNNAENSQQVVVAVGVGFNARLDGFIVRGGNADGITQAGGGAYLFMSDLTIANCLFAENSAALAGGGMWAGGGGNPGLTNVIFFNNRSGRRGGGMAVDGASVTAQNVTWLSNDVTTADTTGGGGGVSVEGSGSMISANGVFNNNFLVVEGNGAALLNDGSFVDCVGCTVYGNTSMFGRVPIHAENGITGFVNGIIWGNPSAAAEQISFTGTQPSVAYSTLQYGWSPPSTAVVSLDRSFVDPVGPDMNAGTLDDNLRLQITSPVIDAGINANIPIDAYDTDEDGDFMEVIDVDRDLNPRRVDVPGVMDTGVGLSPVVDMGAYER